LGGEEKLRTHNPPKLWVSLFPVPKDLALRDLEDQLKTWKGEGGGPRKEKEKNPLLSKVKSFMPDGTQHPRAQIVRANLRQIWGREGKKKKGKRDIGEVNTSGLSSHQGVENGGRARRDEDDRTPLGKLFNWGEKRNLKEKVKG